LPETIFHKVGDCLVGKSAHLAMTSAMNQNPQRRLGRLERQSDWGRHPPPFHESVMNRPKAGDLTYAEAITVAGQCRIPTDFAAI